jgi:hypothetical protein
MRKWFRSGIALAVSLTILGGCGADRESASPVDSTLDLAGVANDCPGGVISQDIAQIFPTQKSLRHVATVNCGQIFKDFEKGKQQEAIQKAFKFFQKTLQQNEKSQLLDPDPSVEAKIVHLFSTIFSGIGVTIPEIDPEVLMDGEYAIGELVPDGPPLLTVSKHAGIDDGGGLFGPVSVFIVKIEAAGGGLTDCPAGIDDRFDCYPLFYDYTVTPESNVNPAIGLKLGQCNVSPPGVEVELLTPEGFLPEDDAPVGLDCTDVQPEVAMTGWRSYAWTVLEPVSPLFRVTPAFAGKNPIGGRISNFSPVAPADPSSGGGGEETLGSVSGTIFDGSDQSPIQGATVQLVTPGDVPAGSTTTNADGNYTFTELDLGNYQVKASAVSFQPDSSAPFALTEESPDADVDVGLEPEDGEDPPPPPPGTDIVVFNDLNVFDAIRMANANNVALVQNLVDFTTGKPRDDGDEVWIDCRTSVMSDPGCTDGSIFHNTIENQGLATVEIFEGSLEDLPAEVKVLILWLPTTVYPTAEINAFKQFAAEGGRIVFVGEHNGFYGPYIPAQNAFLEDLGAVLRNVGGLFDCGQVVLPESALRPHQITQGLTNLTIACSSEIVLGPGDFPLYVDSTGTHVLSGVATIDTTPIDEPAVASSRSVRIQAVPARSHDPVGRPIGDR